LPFASTATDPGDPIATSVAAARAMPQANAVAITGNAMRASHLALCVFIVRSSFAARSRRPVNASTEWSIAS
jgi:hypothetical protein